MKKGGRGGDPLLEQAYPSWSKAWVLAPTSEVLFQQCLVANVHFVTARRVSKPGKSQRQQCTSAKRGCGVCTVPKIAIAKTSCFLKHDRRMEMLEVQEETAPKEFLPFTFGQ